MSPAQRLHASERCNGPERISHPVRGVDIRARHSDEPSEATLIYADDFEQFPVGTDLTVATYTPAVGPTDSARFTSFAGGGSSNTVVDFGGSHAVQLSLPIGSSTITAADHTRAAFASTPRSQSTRFELLPL